MATLWYWIVAVMLAAYVVLDGFDLGVGILLPFVARTEVERQQCIQSIGPVWDGNEVWLLAGGGTLFFAFPQVYASSFSGFYLPLIIVLWLLVLRGVSVELRMHFEDPLWRSFFDGLLMFASALLAIFFGAALANVLRGVPLGPDHFFFLPLWTNWRTGSDPGILDWYTVIGGVIALLTLALHGALYLVMKGEGELQRRARVAAGRLWPVVTIATLLAIPATVIARPDALKNYYGHPAAFLVPVVVALSLGAMLVAIRKGAELSAFLCSSAYLIAMLCGAAVGLYPVLLPSTNPLGESLTIANSIVGPYSLRVGLIWWIFGIMLAITYFSIVYWMFRGKVSRSGVVYGH
ncbi:MAG: cytochrome d ubiquinol oxidase subunit II [Acidobacteriaceae bacterium]